MERRRLKAPPKIKILEAAGSIADGRVDILESSGARVEAVVRSSGGDRSYRVVLEIIGLRTILASSEDNGTRFRGYIGYPIISVMILKGLLPEDKDVEKALKGVPWRVLNEKFKSYEKVLEVVFKEVEARGGKILLEKTRIYMDDVAKKLGEYEVYLSGM